MPWHLQLASKSIAFTSLPSTIQRTIRVADCAFRKTLTDEHLGDGASAVWVLRNALEATAGAVTKDLQPNCQQPGRELSTSA